MAASTVGQGGSQPHPPISLEDAVRILSAYRAEVRARSAEAEEESTR